jgi:hypothetical protein
MTDVGRSVKQVEWSERAGVRRPVYFEDPGPRATTAATDL